jgi:hypothetical protein
MIRLALALLLLAGAPAFAAADPAQQFAGLFIQSCLAFAGSAPAQRAWARQNKLVEVPAPASTAFLHGASGTVFDASNASGKFVLVSADGGSCSVMTDALSGSAVLRGLEAELTKAGVQFRMLQERDDVDVRTLSYREYSASRNGRAWRILAGTVKDQKAGQAMLTADPG